MKAAVLLIIALAACSPANWRRANYATAATAAVAVACDWGQTRSAAEQHWSGGRHEGNPMLGAQPDVGTVDAWFLISTGAIVLVAAVAPEKWRPFLLGSVALAEANTITGNVVWTTGVCGL